MPYIKLARRAQLDPLIDELIPELACAGDLNYAITRMVDEVYGGADTPYNYFNAVIGVLECVKQEYYRKRVAPYEDKKCKENGEVYL